MRILILIMSISLCHAQLHDELPRLEKSVFIRFSNDTNCVVDYLNSRCDKDGFCPVFFVKNFGFVYSTKNSGRYKTRKK